MTTEEILREYEKRAIAARQRLASYRRCEQAYYGDEAGAGNERGMDGYGRPIERLMQTREDLRQRGGAPNMLAPIVDDRVSQRGRLPRIKVIPWDDQPESAEATLKLSRVLNSQWLQSNMKVQAPEGAWYLSVKGEFLVSLTPVFPGSELDTPLNPPGVYLTTVDPGVCYPSFGSGWQRYLLQDVIVREDMTGDQARQRWPQVAISRDEDTVPVTHYLGPDHNCVIVKQQEVARVDHHLGFCPAEWVRNKALGRFGQSDIAHALELHAEYQIMFLVMADALVESTYSQLVVVDPAAMGEKIETGPGAEPIVVKQGGNVFRLQPNSPPQAAQMIMGAAWDQITRMTESTPIRQEGQIAGSNLSGRAITGVQGPQQERVALQQIMLAHHYEHINSMIMAMFDALPAFKDTEMTVYGTEAGKAYVETFTGADFKGWTRNEVRFGSPLGTNSHERSVVALNLHDKHMLSGERVLEELEMEDPDRLISAARDDLVAEAKLMQSVQGPPPGGGGAPPGAAPGPPGAGAPPGGGASPPGPAQPPPPEAGGQGGPQLSPFPPVDAAPTSETQGVALPLPDMQKKLDLGQRLAAVKIRGEILNARPIPGGVLVTIDDPVDKSTVRNAYHQAGFERVEFEVKRSA